MRVLITESIESWPGKYSWRTMINALKDTRPTTQINKCDHLYKTTHEAISKVTRDFKKNSFNTAIAHMMTFSNTLASLKDTVRLGRKLWSSLSQ